MENKPVFIRFGIAFSSLVLLFLWLNHFQIFEEVQRLITHYGFYAKAMIYAGTFCLGIFCFTVLLCSGILSRSAAIILGALASTIELFYYVSSNTLYDVNDVSITLSAQEHIGPMLKSGALLYIPALLVFALLFWVVGRWVKGSRSKRNTIGGWFGFIIAIGLSAMMIRSTNGNRQAFSSPVKLPVLMWYAQSNALYNGPRQIVQEEVNLMIDRPRHIIVIVDESVRGDYLGINNIEKYTTPYLDSLPMLNLGVGYSAGICSDYSNIIMMTGIQMDELPDTTQTIRSRPTIFQYAQKAGYKTAFIDAQSLSDKPDGLMTEDDFNYIDVYKQVIRDYPAIVDYDRDIYGLKILNNILQTDKPTFTYFIKYGCHFPYEESYPPSYQKRRPIAPIQSWDYSQKPAVINNYKNAVEWSVDHFFEELTTTINLENTLVLYTSDHGQNVMDEEDLYLTHCLKSEAPASMAKVPLIILDQQGFVSDSLPVRQYSHFDLFGSITTLMGYDIPNLSSINEQTGELYYSSGDVFGRTKMYKNRVE